jgi:plastocyanin
VAIIKLDTEGEAAFRDETLNNVTGTITVEEGAAPTPSPSPAAGGEYSAELEVTMVDSQFEPRELFVNAEGAFRITLTNVGQYVHNMRIAGEDNEFETDDDIVLTPFAEKGGGTAELTGQIDKPGTYKFRCDFHPTEMSGTITAQ